LALEDEQYCEEEKAEAEEAEEKAPLQLRPEG
jgi:hypothetical protein